MKTYRLSFAFFLLAGILLFSPGCKKEPQETGNGTIELVCRAHWAGEPIVIGSAVDYPQGFSLKFYVLDYLLSNVMVEDAQGNSHELTDVEMVSFTENNDDLSSAEAGVIFRFEDVPAEMYDRLALGIGVDPEKNATKPQTYPSGHPLSIGANRYWDAWGSYIFSKTQGLADDAKPGLFNHPFSYHTGGTELYREISFDRVIAVKEGQVTRIELDLDVKKLFLKSDGSYWDISGSSQAHEPAKPALVMIADNYGQALTLK